VIVRQSSVEATPLSSVASSPTGYLECPGWKCSRDGLPNYLHVLTPRPNAKYVFCKYTNSIRIRDFFNFRVNALPPYPQYYRVACPRPHGITMVSDSIPAVLPLILFPLPWIYRGYRGFPVVPIPMQLSTRESAL